MYSTMTCADCIRSKHLLDKLGVSCEIKYIDSDLSARNEFMTFGGKSANRIPRIVFLGSSKERQYPSGDTRVIETLYEPSDTALQSALKSHGFLK